MLNLKHLPKWIISKKCYFKYSQVLLITKRKKTAYFKLYFNVYKKVIFRMDLHSCFCGIIKVFQLQIIWWMNSMKALHMDTTCPFFEYLYFQRKYSWYFTKSFATEIYHMDCLEIMAHSEGKISETTCLTRVNLGLNMII